MAKLKITKSQYDNIIINEHKRRLKASLTTFNENTPTGKESLKEGLKEVVLGVGQLMGLKLTGQNKIMAQDAITNKDVMNQIKITLEDETKRNELISKLEEKGMSNPESKLSSRANNIVTKFNNISEENNFNLKLDTSTLLDLTQLDEGWKKALATAALGGAMALGGGDAKAQSDSIPQQDSTEMHVSPTTQDSIPAAKTYGGHVRLQHSKIDSIETSTPENSTKVFKRMQATGFDSTNTYGFGAGMSNNIAIAKRKGMRMAMANAAYEKNDGAGAASIHTVKILEEHLFKHSTGKAVYVVVIDVEFMGK